jgi:phage terminase large subunit-like protein
MTKGEQVMAQGVEVESGSDRLTQVFEPPLAPLIGSPVPRIHTPLNDLPSRGFELIDFADTIFENGFMPWQKWLAEHSLKVKPDGRWQHPITVTTVARQNGKSTYMLALIAMKLFHWNESLQVASAHRLVTSLEQFRSLVAIIEANDDLAKRVKRIRCQHGAEEIETLEGCRFVIKAGGSAARGLSKPESVHLDELREMRDIESFASLRYTLMAAKNPMVSAFTNAGDIHSVVLNSLRERGVAAAAGAADDIGYFEWSAASDDITDPENWKAANPAMGHTINVDNIKAVLNDPPDVVMTEVLCRWVTSINSCVDSAKWQACSDDTVELDPEKLTWLAIDISPDRKHAALVGAQKRANDEGFNVKLLHTWTNDLQLDDKAIANDAAHYCRKYAMEYLLFSRRTSGAVAARMQPAGIPIFDMDSAYPQACDEMLGAINSGRLHHKPDSELTTQMLSAVQLRRGDGGWVIGRRASQAAVCAAVATALVTHFATRQETEIDILVG